MNKKLIILGVIIGFICTVIGASLYLFLLTSFNLFSDIEIIKCGKGGKDWAEYVRQGRAVHFPIVDLL